MSKVLVDRELLENCRDAAKDAHAASLLKELESILEAQPAEAEGVGIKKFEFEIGEGGPVTEPLVRYKDHLAALSAVTAERDALAARLGEWARSTLAQIMRENVELTAERDRLREDISQVRGANKILRTASNMVRDERDQLRAEVEALRNELAGKPLVC